jgi:hypothetical protein
MGIGFSQEKLTEQELAEAFDADLNENYGAFEISGHQFWAADIMKSADPIMYRVRLTDYADFLLEQGYEIEGY